MKSCIKQNKNSRKNSKILMGGSKKRGRTGKMIERRTGSKEKE